MNTSSTTSNINVVGNAILPISSVDSFDPSSAINVVPCVESQTIFQASINSVSYPLFQEISLLQAADEITEVEACQLREMVIREDTRVQEALRQHALYRNGYLWYNII